jgi:hypothetical protein
MKTTSRFRPACAAFLALCLLVPASTGTPVFSAPPGAVPSTIDRQALTQVLGDSSEWVIPPQNVGVIDANGQKALIPANKVALGLETKAKIQSPAQYTAIVRLRPEAKTSAYVTLQMLNQVRPDKTQGNLTFSLNTTNGLNTLTTGMVVVGSKDIKPIYKTIFFDPVNEVSLAWSEEMRATIESQIANAPKVADTILVVRATVANNKFRVWVNGRMIGEQPIPADFEKSGTFRFTATPGTEVLYVRATPLISTGRFEPVSLDFNTNSTKLAGDSVLPDSLPGIINPDSIAAGRTATVTGVPFEFPSPKAGLQPQVDIGQSWTRFGSVAGYIAANFGAFGGRWVAGHHIDPARIALSVPTARYKALHLIAVADGRPDSVPVVSAQFYRPDAGHPISFSANKVPSLKDRSTSPGIPVKLASGKEATLYHITIPLDPDAFSWFSDLNMIGVELTKQVQYYRAYPDPLEYSYHGGGLPSSVQVYAMTLERADLDIDIVPDTYGHTWTAPQQPKYNIVLKNESGKPSTVRLTIATASSDGTDKTSRQQDIVLTPSNNPVTVPVTLKPTRYGLQELSVTVTSDTGSNTFKRNFAHLHPNTREQVTWEEGRGPIFGFWGWGGGHDTPKVDKELPAMAAAGMETSTSNYSKSPPEILAMAEKYHFVSEAAFDAGVMYTNGFVFQTAGYPKWNPENPDQSGKDVVENLKAREMPKNAVSRPTYVPFFAEPQIGNITTGIWPTHYGEDYKLTEAEQKTYESMLARYKASAGAIRKQWPQYKLLLPYGDPMNAAVFLRLNKDIAPLIDGVALDLPGFERLPEQQVNQVVLNRMFPVLGDIKKYKKDPYFVLVEGTHISSKDIDTGQIGQADISIRNYLVLMGYGITKFDSGNAPYDCANYWGENHYGGGWMSRLPMAMPKLAYVHLATITRNLNRCNFVKYIPTGSTSTYCQQYKHYKTGQLVHPFWTVRGSRDVTLAVPAGASITLVDPEDNETVLKPVNGTVTFKIGQSPVYIHGLTADPVITLSQSDHSDSLPSPLSKKVANLADGNWNIVVESDEEYLKNKPLQIERFQGNMTAKAVDAPSQQGSKALAINLPKQEKDRGVMPFYTTLKPTKPLTLPGRGKELGMWVHASSDWGRVVYTVRDAKGEKWISVGTKEDWNCDDIHGWSNFCFDGWRYVTFQLPSSLPYDSYRAHGTSWWGSYGGDGVVDLPLSLEKITIERRPKAIVGNDLVPVSPDDVLLGDLYVEYETPQDQTKEAVRLSALRMPLPADKETAGMKNPITELQTSGVGAATTVLGVKDPEHQYDGTRCHVNFTPVAGAASYDVWVSAYADGRGALKLGSAWPQSGGLIASLRPDRQFWVFVTYTDKDKKVSKPSEGFKFVLQDRFGYK